MGLVQEVYPREALLTEAVAFAMDAKVILKPPCIFH
jgi:hypothetical protein